MGKLEIKLSVNCNLDSKSSDLRSNFTSVRQSYLMCTYVCNYDVFIVEIRINRKLETKLSVICNPDSKSSDLHSTLTMW